MGSSVGSASCLKSLPNELPASEITPLQLQGAWAWPSEGNTQEPEVTFELSCPHGLRLLTSHSLCGRISGQKWKMAGFLRGRLDGRIQVSSRFHLDPGKELHRAKIWLLLVG